MENAAEFENELPSSGALEMLSPEIRATFSKYGKFEMLPRGSHVIKQGTEHSAMSVLLSGSLKVSCHAHGDTVELATLKPGDLVGEVSLIDAYHASADVVVDGQDAAMWTIDKDSFDRFLDEVPESGVKVLRVIARELCHLLRQNSDKMLREIEVRRARYLDLDY